MNRSHIISVLLAVVLATISVAPAEACEMTETGSDTRSSLASEVAQPCHDPVPQDDPRAQPDCADCLDHCPMLAQAALLQHLRLKLTGLDQAKLPVISALSTAGEPTPLFKPPTLVPTLIT